MLAAALLNRSKKHRKVASLLPLWAYCAVVLLEKTLNANIPTIASVQLSEYERKLVTARVPNLAAVPELCNASLYSWKSYISPTLLSRGQASTRRGGSV